MERRDVVRLGLAVPAALIVSGCTDSGAGSSGKPSGVGSSPVGTSPAGSLPATASCVDGDHETAAETEGPYFSKGSPERSDVRAVATGTLLTITGLVVTTGCQPVARALLEFWQADNAGNYDNTGYRLRGHQYTGADGAYRLTTIVPATYPGRTSPSCSIRAEIEGRQPLAVWCPRSLPVGRSLQYDPIGSDD